MQDRRILYAAACVRAVSTSLTGVLMGALLIRISTLFAIDGLACGFLTTALLSYFFFVRFGVSEGAIGGLFLGARVLNAGSHLAAAWLAKRIGLVNTRVFTHIPSSLLLVTVAFAPNFTVAAIVFLLREGLVEMDVPTRQSYVLAVVEPNERTVASGVTNLVRVAAWAVAPPFAGLLMHGGSMAAPLAIGAAMKIGYDLLLPCLPPHPSTRRSGRRTRANELNPSESPAQAPRAASSRCTPTCPGTSSSRRTPTCPGGIFFLTSFSRASNRRALRLTLGHVVARHLRSIERMHRGTPFASRHTAFAGLRCHMYVQNTVI